MVSGFVAGQFQSHQSPLGMGVALDQGGPTDEVDVVGQVDCEPDARFKRVDLVIELGAVEDQTRFDAGECRERRARGV